MDWPSKLHRDTRPFDRGLAHQYLGAANIAFTPFHASTPLGDDQLSNAARICAASSSSRTKCSRMILGESPPSYWQCKASCGGRHTRCAAGSCRRFRTCPAAAGATARLPPIARAPRRKADAPVGWGHPKRCRSTASPPPSPGKSLSRSISGATCAVNRPPHPGSTLRWRSSSLIL